MDTSIYRDQQKFIHFFLMSVPCSVFYRDHVSVIYIETSIIVPVSQVIIVGGVHVVIWDMLSFLHTACFLCIFSSLMYSLDTRYIRSKSLDSDKNLKSIL